MLARRFICFSCRKDFLSCSAKAVNGKSFPTTPTTFFRRETFSSKIEEQHGDGQRDSSEEESSKLLDKLRKGSTRSPAAKTSLRRVAVEAQRSRQRKALYQDQVDERLSKSKVSK